MLPELLSGPALSGRAEYERSYQLSDSDRNPGTTGGTVAFSLFVKDPTFAPEKIQSAALKAWGGILVQRPAEEHTRLALQHAEDHLNLDIVAAAEALLAVWDRIELMALASQHRTRA